MSIKTLVAPFAIAVGLGFSGAAMAQTMVGTIEVSDEDLPVVEQYCNHLENAYDMEDGATIPDFEATVEQEVAVNVELDSITRDDCIEAGLTDMDGGNVEESALPED
ncbi:hypothetical protein [Pelagibacterium montanilacus]|uniref:hypothetical protein n=1 Tax=Pelagibacterium montanilacus TaxID=2185280 RepID=UPI000F8CFB7B|nr:hypothetical protein [Pelagibacterium montanilacus]